MREAQTSHIDELIRVAEGARSARDAIIHQSWRRCIGDHKLDPTVLREAHILPSEHLREHRDAMDEFLHTARFAVETLYRQVAGLGYVLLLTDAKGVTVDFIGDPTFDNQLRKAGLYLGADWNERHAGTCAVGTCVMTGEALTVHQSDHFDATHIPLTCTAAPIFDSRGQPAAVLDISALRSPEPKASQHLALELVKSWAHKIENANLLNSFRREWIVKLSASREFADIDPDFVMALDGAGRIIGFNHRARQLLAREAGIPWQDGARLLGQPFAAFFECRGVEDLVRFARSRPTDQRTIRLTRSGGLLFAQTLPPPTIVAPGERSKTAVEIALPKLLREISGGDPALQPILARAARLANTRMSLLIRGETGTGKEHFAKALHASSVRAGRPFVAVNCAALPETLIESELFGYEAGSFTGATARGKKGLILEADAGTLFLDEIGDMPLALQTRLLRVLAEREVTPIGRSKALPVDIRVIAATHRDLADLVKQGKFREDLYFRLNGAVLTLPPLRQRADLDWLIERLLADRAARDGVEYRMSAPVLAALRAHSWPGNIRELANVIDYACAVSAGCAGAIELEDLPEHVQQQGVFEAWPAGMPAEADSAAGASSSQAERLREALRRNRWNVSAVAREMEIDRSTVHRQMRRLGIVPPHRVE